MASSPRPTTPNQALRRWAVNRAVTLPPSLSTGSKHLDDPEIGSIEGVETIFTHPNATVVKFTTVGSPRPTTTSSSPGTSGSIAGTLSWASPSETTIAAGPLQIYRVPGSVSFLRSGSLLHAIMPRSQCWCVDGVSKFVLRVLPDTYYRIELPGSTEDGLQKVEQMKATLQKVLFYERSACPFSRTFSLDLPEMPDVKARRRRAVGPAKKWKMDRAFTWKPEGLMSGAYGSSGEEPSSGPASSLGSDEEQEDGESSSVTQKPFLGDADELVDGVRDLDLDTPTRPKPLQSLRSPSAPTRIPAQLQPQPRQIYTGVDVDGAIGAIESAEAERSSRIDAQAQSSGSSRTVTFQAMPTDMPPSAPDSSAGLDPASVQDSQSSTHQLGQGKDHSQSAGIADIPTLDASDTGAEFPSEDASANHIHLSEETKEYMREIERQQNENSFDAAATEPLSVHETDVDPTSTLSPLAEHYSASSEGAASSNDPYAAIRARILARRSIGGTTSFHPADQKTSSRSSMSSTSSSGTIASNKSGMSHASTRQQHALASALVKKACAVFLGPPTSLVALMLRIAARFANVAFGVDSMFYVATPVRTPRRVPGSFNLSEGISSDEELDEDDEDDFGVPIRSPVRLAQRDTSFGADVHQPSPGGLKEGQRGRDAD